MLRLLTVAYASEGEVSGAFVGATFTCWYFISGDALQSKWQACCGRGRRVSGMLQWQQSHRCYTGDGSVAL